MTSISILREAGLRFVTSVKTSLGYFSLAGDSDAQLAFLVAAVRKRNQLGVNQHAANHGFDDARTRGLLGMLAGLGDRTTLVYLGEKSVLEEEWRSRRKFHPSRRQRSSRPT